MKFLIIHSVLISRKYRNQKVLSKYYWILLNSISRNLYNSNNNSYSTKMDRRIIMIIKFNCNNYSYHKVIIGFVYRI